jgi:hypothetical protein
VSKFIIWLYPLLFAEYSFVASYINSVSLSLQLNHFAHPFAHTLHSDLLDCKSTFSWYLPTVKGKQHCLRNIGTLFVDCDWSFDFAIRGLIHNIGNIAHYSFPFRMNKLGRQCVEVDKLQWRFCQSC